jgi:hypothetical protein
MRYALALVGSVVAFSLAPACSGTDAGGGFGGQTTSSSGDGTSSSSGTFGGGDGGPAPVCVGLECDRPKDCSGGSNTTTLSGTVFAPNGKDPLYNVLVYVPNGPLAPFVDGVTCETCEKSTLGAPVAVAQTDTSGKFVLKNMPAGADVPLVIQIGRFRRKITIPTIAKCTDTAVASGMARLPKNKSEGDLPQIAIVTSTYDPTECILKEIGIDESEFTPSTGTGRVHLYKGNGNNVSGATSGASLWSSKAMLDKYQLLALPCTSYPSDVAGLKNLYEYANAGGRIFATDLSYPVVSQNNPEWVSTGNFGSPGNFANPASIDTSFPKGLALVEWLKAVGAVTGPSIVLADTYSRVGAISPPGQRWLYSGGSNTQSYTFNTPVSAPVANQCGRVFYSSFHIGTGRSSTGTFPQACQPGALKPQERVLEFMLFDLASCVSSDKEPPPVPR